MLVVAVSAAVGLTWVRREMSRPYQGWPGDSVTVVVERGWNSKRILRQLGDAGVIRSPSLTARYLRLTGGGSGLQAGEYRFDRAASPWEVLERLRRGDVVLYGVTIPEGLTLEETVSRFVEAGLADAGELRAAFRDPEVIRSFDPDALDLEGYLFPETYRFARNIEPRVIAATLAQAFLAAVGPEYGVSARDAGLTPRQAVTLASMIEKETGVHAERARISRVFHNRLALGMRLQCDPTVIYALTRDGRYRGQLTSADLRYPSAWNTYFAAGLPPGPIASPGKEALQAAIRPTPGNELYFVAAPGGGHRFSSSLEAHNRAVAAWRGYVRSSR